jgi:crossover junction endodeoxyribonuclease RuvC
MTRPIRILGIDPGLRRTGWGMIACAGNRLSFLSSGVVASSDALPLAGRLVELHAGLEDVLREWQPDEVAVEQTFVNVNATATLKLGHARAVALLVPAMAGLDVAEYAPNAVKKSVVGAGHADKRQIRKMVEVLLPKAEFCSDDAADALAIAITHAHQRKAPALAAALAG